MTSTQYVDRVFLAAVDAARRLLATPRRCAAVLACCLAGCIYSLAIMRRVGVGLEARDVLPDDSYMIDFFDEYDAYWPGERVWGTTLIVTFRPARDSQSPLDVRRRDTPRRRGVDYTSIADRTKLGYDPWLVTPKESLFGRIEAQDDALSEVGQPTSTWLRKALEDSGGGHADLTPEELDDSLAATIHPVRDMTCGGEKPPSCLASKFERAVTAARYFFYHVIADDTIRAHRVDLRYRDLIEDAGFGRCDAEDAKSGCDAYLWNEMFMYGVSDSLIHGMTLATVAAAARAA